jgi:hypothetical protein
MAPQIGAVVVDRTLPFVSLALLGYTWYVYVIRVCSKYLLWSFWDKKQIGGHNVNH